MSRLSVRSRRCLGWISIAAALGVLTACSSSTGGARNGLTDEGRPTAELTRAVRALESALDKRDLGALRSMAAPDNSMTYFDETVSDYGGHPVHATDYESSLPGEVMVGLTADCGTGRSAEFGIDFLYQHGGWRPAFGPDASQGSAAPGPDFPSARLPSGAASASAGTDGCPVR
ncbi:hypothetical protein [Streptacidiphilus sp. P02-A3a]|uniref:hypothetical protein n=1 Tax=Streptacidiphilus sp. P02-A3a TaxID=2704468 RepID=UPI0015FAF278|nr:hypothetical protein [Streptacidiphilus sp. P02-A3a]QMU71742.1 hypothetical protein GXP74_29340 [Streptacidiphilus sp. P02-A3a]